MQFCRKIFPLITVPYLTRMLKPSGWGTVAFVLAMSEIVALVIEFGFNLSATREISRHRHDRGRCSEVMAGVLGAQIVLSVVGITLASVVARHMPLLRNQPR